MLIIKDTKNIERALKQLKGKVIRTKQNRKLNEKKYFTKKSVKRRAEIGKAKYVQNKFGDKN
jgi:small subunit ribosomal protein S21